MAKPTAAIQPVVLTAVDGTLTDPGTQYVWDTNALAWVRMEQPTIEGETINVAISGPLAVTGTFWQATQPVSVASLPSHDVTNAGTFAVQASWAAAQHIIVDSGALTVTLASTTITGTVAVSGTFWQSTQPVSLASVPSHAVTNAGTFVVQATLDAETTKVIGTVNISAGQTIGTVTTVGTLTTITNAVTVAQATGTNLHMVVDSGAVTATVASTTITATVQPSGLATVVGGTQETTTPGTPVQLTTQACKLVTIRAADYNVGVVVIGPSTIVPWPRCRLGADLYPGDSRDFAVDNLSRLYMDATNNGDAISWVAYA